MICTYVLGIAYWRPIIAMVYPQDNQASQHYLYLKVKDKPTGSIIVAQNI